MKKLVFLFLFLSANAFAQFGTGCLIDSARYEKVELTAPLLRGNLPASASVKEYAPQPGNQGNHGTCTAWASAYACRSILLNMRNEGKTAYAFSPSYVYNQIRLMDNCDYGVYISDALELLKNDGCAPYDKFGYECSRKVDNSLKKIAKEYTIRDYKKLFSRNSPINEQSIVYPVKKALSESKPVVISMKCWASFEDAEDVWIPVEKDQSKGYHAMAVVAYDDNQYGGAFLLMNSWGVNWGKGGFTWVRYEDFFENCMEAYELIDHHLSPNAAKISFSGDIRFQKSDRSPMNAYLDKKMYKMNEEYYSGTAFQFFVSHQEPIYLYVIGTDLTGKCSVLFPFDQKISPMLSYKQGTIAFPAQDYYIEFDDQKGKEYVCVLYSQERLDINQISAKMEYATGDVWERLSQAVGKDKISPDIEYRKDKIGFKANRLKNSKAGIVPLVVEIRHE